MWKYLVCTFGVMVSACATLPEQPVLSPELLTLDARLTAMDHLEPNLRGSQVYTALKDEYDMGDIETVADTGNSMARLILGFYHKYDMNMDETIQAYTQACDMGNTLGCVNLGTVFENGFYAKHTSQMDGPNHKAAHKLYTQACDLGNAIGCRLLGRQYRQTHLPITDFGTARGLYKKSCDLGNAYGCYDLGRMYYKGVSVEKDKDLAIVLFRKACDATGHEAACLRLKRLTS